MKTATASSLFVCHAGGVEEAGGNLGETVIVIEKEKTSIVFLLEDN